MLRTFTKGFLASVASLACGLASTAHAINVSSCQTIGSGSYTLTQNLSTASGSCITVNAAGATTLNLNGKSISCTSATGCGTDSAAVRANSNGNRITVKNGKINGGFSHAVTLNPASWSEYVIAESLDISGVGGPVSPWLFSAALWVSGAQGNVIHSIGAENAIVWSPGDNASAAAQVAGSNFIDCDYCNGILAVPKYTGSGVPAIDGNYIRTGGIGIADYSYGNFASAYRVKATNIFTGANGPMTATISGSINVDSQGGICDRSAAETSTPPTCNLPTAPFALP